MNQSLTTSARSKLNRLKERGINDRDTVNGILDEGLICHVAINQGAQASVIPMTYGRQGDYLILHGALPTRLMNHLQQGHQISLCVTLLDGLVLARSTFHHSMNYRSVVLFGQCEIIEDWQEKAIALECLVEHLIPGRTADTRAANRKELNATRVLSFPISEGGAKIRSGPPIDNDEDCALDIWAGVLPLTLQRGKAKNAPDLSTTIRPPDYV